MSKHSQRKKSYYDLGRQDARSDQTYRLNNHRFLYRSDYEQGFRHEERCMNKSGRYSLRQNIKKRDKLMLNQRLRWNKMMMRYRDREEDDDIFPPPARQSYYWLYVTLFAVVLLFLL